METRNYIIPVNYNSGGYFWNGLIERRKAIEGGIFGLFGALLCSLLGVPFNIDGLPIYILSFGFLALLGIHGIGGQSFSVFIFHLILWARNRSKPYIYNPNCPAYTVTPTELAKTEVTFRDKLANRIDKIRDSAAGSEKTYIEGETFQFASDPLLESLAFAQEQREQEAAEQAAGPAAEPEQAEPLEAAPAHDSIDVDQMIDQIVLQELPDTEEQP